MTRDHRPAEREVWTRLTRPTDAASALLTGAILGAITALPGLDRRSIARMLGASDKEVRAALSVLESDALVSSCTHTASDRWFSQLPHVLGEDADLMVGDWRPRGRGLDLLRRLANWTSTSPPTQRRLAADLSITQQMVSLYLLEFKARGVIGPDGGHPSRRYRLTAMGTRILHEAASDAELDE